MQKRDNIFSAGKFLFFSCLLILSLSPVNLFSQSITNLDVFNKLIDSAAVQIKNALPASSKNIYLQLNLGQSYSVFGNRLIGDLQSAGINVSTIKDSASRQSTELNFVIDGARVKYGDMFRKTLFGAFYIPRNISIKGNYAVITDHSSVHNYSFSSIDTVKVSGVHDLENPAYPFTHAELPPEPFFSSIYEPVIAIGTAAVAVYLFFKVRSK